MTGGTTIFCGHTHICFILTFDLWTRFESSLLTICKRLGKKQNYPHVDEVISLISHNVAPPSYELVYNPVNYFDIAQVQNSSYVHQLSYHTWYTMIYSKSGLNPLWNPHVSWFNSHLPLVSAGQASSTDSLQCTSPSNGWGGPGPIVGGSKTTRKWFVNGWK